MNRTYRTVWNERRQTWMAAAETARSPGGARCPASASAALVALIAGALPLAASADAVPATALPRHGVVTAGQAEIGSSGSSMTIRQGSAKAAIDWQGFSIGKDAAVTFVQPDASAVTLNRVTGTEASVIDGALKANGQVFVLNPNGVLFGQGARVDTAGLVATTLGLGNADFLAGKTSFSGSSKASVRNQGTLTAADGGYVALIGQSVRNDGVIAARLGTVALAAGAKVSLRFEGESLIGVAVDEGVLDSLVANQGAIRADGGWVLLTAKGAGSLLDTLVNNTGEIRAQTIANKSGRIFLLGDGGAVEVAGTLDTSAPGGGDGGFVETSGSALRVLAGARVDTHASGPSGANGTWLIDPTDFTISSGAAAQTTSGIGATALQNALGAGNVTIQTQASGTAAGDINVNAPVAWSANRLALEAHGDINVNAVMTASGSSTLNLKTGYNFNTASPAFDASKTLRMGMDANGAFAGRIDIDRTGTGILTINNAGYALVSLLGSEGSQTAADLQGMQANPGINYAMAGNIDAQATGSWSLNYGGFQPVDLRGTFDGLGHTIANLHIATGNDNVGLFGQTTNGVIRNVGLPAASITGNNNVGALVGLSSRGMVSNSWSSGVVNGAGVNVGGLVGQAVDMPISASWSSATMNGQADVGGLVGYFTTRSTGDALLSGSHASGAVTGGNQTGGLVGMLQGASLTSSYATGRVIGADFTGGLVGEIQGANNPVTDVYATGNVDGAQWTGGLAGKTSLSLNVTNAHATGVVTATGVNSGGLMGEFNCNNVQACVLQDSYATGDVHGAAGVGGLVGYVDQPGTLTRLYSVGSVTGNNVDRGGLFGSVVGQANVGSVLSNSYSRSNVNGPQGGGLIGTASNVEISNSYATGTAGGGGLVGMIDTFMGSIVVNNSFWDVHASQQATTQNSGQGTGLGSAAMTTTSTYTAAGWNFTSRTGVWVRKDGVNGNYPFLRTASYVDTTSLTLSFTGAPLTMTYGDAAPSLASLSIAGCSACLSVTWGSAVGSTTHAGSYAYATTSNMFSLNWGGGVNPSDYDVTLPTGFLLVNPRVLTVAANAGATRVYDGTTQAAASLFQLGNVVNGDSVALSGQAALANKNVGNHGVGIGALAVNNADYTLGNAAPTGTIAITPASLTVTATGGSQVYDGTRVAQVVLSSNQVSGDQLVLSDAGATLNDKNVGNGKTVTVSGIAVSGADAGNYTLQSSTATTSTNVTAAHLTVTASRNSLAEIVNGGVRLPSGVDQLLFVVKAGQ